MTSLASEVFRRTVQHDDDEENASLTVSGSAPTVITYSPWFGPGHRETRVAFVRVVSPSWRKYFWYSSPVDPTGSYMLFLETSDEQLGQPGDAEAVSVPWPTLWQPPEPDPAVWRGVFAPAHAPKVLFTKELSFRTADLQRWTPNVVLGRRDVEGRDE